jgi:hypothetical protein
MNKLRALKKTLALRSLISARHRHRRGRPDAGSQERQCVVATLSTHHRRVFISPPLRGDGHGAPLLGMHISMSLRLPLQPKDVEFAQRNGRLNKRCDQKERKGDPDEGQGDLLSSIIEGGILGIAFKEIL